MRERTSRYLGRLDGSDKSEKIDLLITDVVMPGIDGPALVPKVRGDALRQRIGEDRKIHFLTKLFSATQLAGTVKDGLHPL